MLDPLSDVIALLRPRAVFSKGISGGGRWGVSYAALGHPSFCTVLEGSCRLAVDGLEPVVLRAGDFVLLPATPGFTMSGFEPARPVQFDPHAAAGRSGEIHHGDPDGPVDVRQLGGWFLFDSPDADLLVAQLPSMIHVRGAGRLAALVEMVAEEAADERPGRDLALARLVELLLIEALRSVQGEGAPAGLLRGLADARLAAAIREMHGDPARAWTVAKLAAHAALSRSAFFDRFMRTMGVTPMEYLLAWRMALAKELLRRGGLALGEVAERVGYSSATTFSTAFSRHVGLAPGRFARSAA